MTLPTFSMIFTKLQQHTEKAHKNFGFKLKSLMKNTAHNTKVIHTFFSKTMNEFMTTSEFCIAWNASLSGKKKCEFQQI